MVRPAIEEVSGTGRKSYPSAQMQAIAPHGLGWDRETALGEVTSEVSVRMAAQQGATCHASKGPLGSGVSGVPEDEILGKERTGIYESKTGAGGGNRNFHGY